MRRLELFYGTGGHGGPYSNVDHAIYRAVCLLRGNPTERSIEVRKGDFSTVVATVEKRDDGIYVVWPALELWNGIVPAFDFKVSDGIGHTGLRFSTAEVLS